jgi:hypothetical protein
MTKVLGIALALLFTLTLAAAAEESFDRAGHSFMLDNATKVTVSETQVPNLVPGEQVKAMYETGGVTGLEPRSIGSEFRSTTNWLPTYGTEINSIQSE